MTETAAQGTVDAFVPAPSVVDVMDPVTEAKARAISAGVEEGPDHVVTGVFPSVWLVIGGTRAHAYVALVSTDERRAWTVARDAIRNTCGVRVERHPLI